jgi:hypothetical protein
VPARMGGCPSKFEPASSASDAASIGRPGADLEAWARASKLALGGAKGPVVGQPLSSEWGGTDDGASRDDEPDEPLPTLHGDGGGARAEAAASPSAALHLELLTQVRIFPARIRIRTHTYGSRKRAGDAGCGCVRRLVGRAAVTRRPRRALAPRPSPTRARPPGSSRREKRLGPPHGTPAARRPSSLLPPRRAAAA